MQMNINKDPISIKVEKEEFLQSDKNDVLTKVRTENEMNI
jgi:hypothetical protein